jgi:hypothetical protein
MAFARWSLTSTVCPSALPAPFSNLAQIQVLCDRTARGTITSPTSRSRCFRASSGIHWAPTNIVRTNEFSRLDEAFDRLLTLRKPLVLLDDDGLDITYFNYDPSQGKFRTPQDRQTHVNEFRVRRQPSYCTIP